MSNAGPVHGRFGHLTIEVVTGDITELAVDAIVNAANNHFWMGGGVAGAIKRRGGAEIEEAAMKLGPVEPGNAVTTTAGRLRARYCIHAAVMGQDLVTNADLVSRATAGALAEAARLELDSVALPALGTGVGGFPVAEAARLMIAAAINHGRTCAKPTNVVFVLFDRPAYQAFVAALETAPAHA
jgi:O-acetyl-ADP-ribose deacetylase (regulator of RNase III)